MPINLLADEMEDNNKRKSPINLLSEEKPEKESLKSALINLYPRLEEDVTGGVMNLAKAIPEYYDKAQTEVPGIVNIARHHPLSIAKQLGAGLTELGHSTLNIPAGIVDYMTDRLHLLPDELKQNVFRQPDISTEINDLFGEPKEPGEALARGLGRNVANVGLARNLVSAMNPLRLTARNITRDVLNTRNAVRNRYAREYNELFQEGNRRGVGRVNINPDRIDINALSEHAGDKYLNSVEQVINHPNLENSQLASSDLGKLIRNLEKRETLTSSERNTLNAARNSQNHINEQMFRNQHGELLEDLSNRRDRLQHGYRTEVVPYTTNPAIKSYLRGELSQKQLVDRLASGKFNVQRGAAHPSIGRREFVKKPYIWGTSLGVLGKSLYDRLAGKNDES